MAAKLLKAAFGKEGSDLYGLLGIEKKANQEQIRKAYHKAALRWHPDKNAGDKAATLKFQALGAAHKILSSSDLRAEYDSSGNLPEEDDMFSSRDERTWRNYFAKVTPESIKAFAKEYVGSEEERKDVLSAYKKGKGNLGKVIDSVMLATEDDLARFQAIVEEAISKGEVTRLEGLAKSAVGSEHSKKRQRRAAKEAGEAEEALASLLKKKKSTPDIGDLAAAIQSRQQARDSNSSFLAQLEEKYTKTSSNSRSSVKKRPAAATG
eukprot:TRINITY_DN7127_c1_g1_i1.p1 TRINITY_DN7127_c1_g1~~TRINITY_DN7127_c1_g1_i1.p1  ORF type:complete len:275 (+),score=71.47 TRINITY_DN7127_c1_g1_i1:33-827(+)